MLSSECRDDQRNLCRPLHPGERIDYFMSHSWHDPNLLKFEKLCEAVEKFFKKQGRHPTFWLDKVYGLSMGA